MVLDALMLAIWETHWELQHLTDFDDLLEDHDAYTALSIEAQRLGKAAGRVSLFYAYLADKLGECEWRKGTAGQLGWQTSCSRTPGILFESGGYCPYCGRRIVTQNVGTSAEVPTECNGGDD